MQGGNGEICDDTATEASSSSLTDSLVRDHVGRGAAVRDDERVRPLPVLADYLKTRQEKGSSGPRKLPQAPLLTAVSSKDRPLAVSSKDSCPLVL